MTSDRPPSCFQASGLLSLHSEMSRVTAPPSLYHHRGNYDDSQLDRSTLLLFPESLYSYLLILSPLHTNIFNRIHRRGALGHHYSLHSSFMTIVLLQFYDHSLHFHSRSGSFGLRPTISFAVHYQTIIFVQVAITTTCFLHSSLGIRPVFK